MTFADLSFWVCFALLLLIFLLIPKSNKINQLVLLVFSYLFYASLQWVFLLPLLFSTLVDFVCGKFASTENAPRTRKIALATSLISNLGLLILFKLVASTEGVSRLVTIYGVDHTAFPIGLSFYTFQSISYTIDVYRGRTKPCTRFYEFALYVAFFPQLLAGPIERSHRLLPQLKKIKGLSYADIEEGIGLILFGLFKKIMIADKLSLLIAPLYTGDIKNGYSFILASLLVTFKVYADFSAYSQIARGIAKFFGVNLTVNFRPFYLAKNPAEFWSRWHLSLTYWVKDYLFNSLIGKRPSRTRFYVSLFISFMTIGVWHGLQWNWLFFGIFHGLLVIAYQFTKRRLGPLKLLVWNYHTMFLVYFVCGVLHETHTIETTVSLFKNLEFARSFATAEFWWYLKSVGILLTPLFFAEFLFYNRKINQWWAQIPIPMKGLLIGALIQFLILMNVGTDLFVYYAF